MLQKKSLLSLLAASALVVACGGGSDSTSTASGTSTADTTTPPAGVTPAPTTPTPTTPTPTTPTPTTPVDTGTTPPATTPPSTTPTIPGTTPATPGSTVPAIDQRFNGHMELVSNQILYLRTNRILYLPVTLSSFEGTTGIVDIASGSPVANLPNLAAEAAAAGCTVAFDGTCAIQPSAVAPAAPIAAFGLRIDSHVLPSVVGQQVGSQTVVGRIAFDLTERAGSVGISGTEVPEIMRFVIDNVEMATDQDGKLTFARLKDGAQIHVYGRNAAGVEVRESIPAPANTVRLMPLTEIPDGFGDTSLILFMDLERGFSQAGTRLAALQSIAGHFAMNVTLSSVEKIVRPAAVASPGFPAVPLKDMIGQSITVNTQTPVTGGGISGSAWIRMYP